MHTFSYCGNDYNDDIHFCQLIGRVTLLIIRLHVEGLSERTRVETVVVCNTTMIGYFKD